MLLVSLTCQILFFSDKRTFLAWLLNVNSVNFPLKCLKGVPEGINFSPVTIHIQEMSGGNTWQIYLTNLNRENFHVYQFHDSKHAFCIQLIKEI